MKGRAKQVDWVAVGAANGHFHSAVRHLRVSEELGVVPYRSVGYAGGRKNSLPISTRFRPNDISDNWHENLAILDAQRICGEARVRAQVGPIGGLAEMPPLAVVAHSENE